MSRVLAAVDTGPVSQAVIKVANCLANVLAARREVVTVDTNALTPTTMAEHAITAPEREASTALLSLADAPDVVAIVVGVRTVTGGPRPAGHVTEHIITNSKIPVVTVPPGTEPDRCSLDQLLVPLDGGAPPGPVTTRIIRAFEAYGATINTLHVFDHSSVPMFWDGWGDRDIWTNQFAHAYSPSAAYTELKTGDVAQQILATAKAHGSSMIVLEWNHQLDHSHAPVIRDLLCNATVPLMLLPATSPEEIDEEKSNDQG